MWNILKVFLQFWSCIFHRGFPKVASISLKEQAFSIYLISFFSVCTQLLENGVTWKEKETAVFFLNLKYASERLDVAIVTAVFLFFYLCA